MSSLPDPPTNSVDWRLVLPMLALLGLVCSIYAPGLGYELVYDDPMLVGASRLTGALGDLPGVLTWDLWASTNQAEASRSGYFRPLFLLSLWLDRQVPQEFWLSAHRLQDVTWHLGATGLVVALAHRWGAGRVAALAAGGVFALHPAHVGAVQFVAARNDLMATAFLLLAVWQIDRPGARGLGSLATLCSAAMLSKESAALAPLLLCMLAVARGVGWRRAAGVGAASAAGVLVAVGLRFSVGVPLPESSGSHAMLAVFGPALGHWAAIAAWPVDLAPGLNLTWPEAAALGAMTLGLVVLVGVGLASGWRGLAWIGAGGLVLIPALAGVAANGLVADRYLYGPLAFWAVALGLAMARLPWFAAVLAGGGLGGALAMQTVRTLPTWSSEIDLWRAGVAAHPQPYTWAAYGAVLEEAGLVAEAARYTERASSTTPPMPHACFNVTRRYLQSGAPAEAVRAGAAALAAGCPRSPELLAPLAVGQALGGDWAEAEATVSGMDGDPTGQAVLVRCAAAVRRGDLEVLLRTARSGRGEPDALRGQVAFLLRASGDEAAALVVEAMPFP